MMEIVTLRKGSVTRIFYVWSDGTARELIDGVPGTKFVFQALFTILLKYGWSEEEKQ